GGYRPRRRNRARAPGHRTARRDVHRQRTENRQREASRGNLPGDCESPAVAQGPHDARGLAAGWVFVSRTGQHLRRNGMRKTFQGILRRAGLPIVRFHDLRHTCATLLMADGQHAKVVQERLGHSDITLTLGTYSHITPTMQWAAASSMQGMLATGS